MSSGSEPLVCSCYFTNNIFLQRYRLHVTFHSQEQFLEEYREVRDQLAMFLCGCGDVKVHDISVAAEEWVQREGRPGTSVG